MSEREGMRVRILRFRAVPVIAAILAAASAARAQSQAWGVGVSGGAVAAAETSFHIDDFHRSDVSAWVDYTLEDQVILRATVGRMHVAAHNAGETVADAPGAVVPADLRDRIDYGLLSVSYNFVETAWTSGAFAGVGAYRIYPGIPAGAAAAGADKDESVWGFHVGLDSEVRVWRGLGILGRITVHIPQTNPHRVLVAADAGLSYRF